MTFLEMAQAAYRDLGHSGAGPTTVVGQSGQHLRAVKAVQEEWTEIQDSKEHWGFLWAPYTFPTVASIGAYAGPSNLERWVMDAYHPVSAYLTATGVSDEGVLEVLDYPEFYQRYRIGTQTDDRPVACTVDPDGHLLLGPVPDAVYTLKGTYYTTATVLAADTDTPVIHSQYHQIIVEGAKLKMGADLEASIPYQEAKRRYDRLYARLLDRYLPEMRVGSAPLA